MSGPQAMRSLSGGIHSGRGTFGSSMRIVLSEAALGEGDLGGLGVGRECRDGVHGSSIWT